MINRINWQFDNLMIINNKKFVKNIGLSSPRYSINHPLVCMQKTTNAHKSANIRWISVKFLLSLFHVFHNLWQQLWRIIEDYCGKKKNSLPQSLKFDQVDEAWWWKDKHFKSLTKSRKSTQVIKCISTACH